MQRPVRPWGGAARNAAQDLIDTIDATGGLTGEDTPVGDPEWLDLGMAYIRACEEMNVPPWYAEEEE